jgi:tricorn protease
MSRPLLIAAFVLSVSPAWGQPAKGYYRHPALHGSQVVFGAEGDLWTVSTEGGAARRLTTHPGEETHPTISPDGQTVGFTARYEGPAELYAMSIDGGLPTRWTYEAEPSVTTTWSPGGELIYATRHYSTLPDWQLVALDLESGRRRRVPLSQASEGAFDATGKTLFFVRPAFHGNVTRRYQGGTARQIWKYVEGAAEAQILTTDYPGESHNPMWWNGRVYFVTDRDGTMNVWSMNETGGDLQQHTEHSGWDVRDASLNEGRIVYQAGADLWLYDIAGDRARELPITLASDFDQLREKWVKKPMKYLTSAHLHPEGESLVLTARGRVFFAPARQGRFRRASTKEGVRYRDAIFMPDGEKILALSDESGELEFVTLPATGVGDQARLTDDGKILRFQGHPSPDGKWIAYTDNDNDLWLLNVQSKEQRILSTNREGVGDVAWAPDSRWLTFSQSALNTYAQIFLYGIEGGALTALTSDRVNSLNAVWSPDGKWIYFLSDRSLTTIVGSPWGPRQPEPYFDKPMKVYQVALQKGLRSPFKPDDELYSPPKKDENGKKEGESEKEDDEEEKPPPPIAIDLEGLQQRVREVPIEAGNYRGLAVNEEAVFWTSRDTGLDGKTHLMALKIDNEDPEPETLVEDIRYFELSGDGKKLLVRKKDDLYVFDAGVEAPSELDEEKVDLEAWTFAMDVREDWRQIFVDAWRLERDYFYDPNMHGVDWDGVRDKYLALVERVTTRDELSDLIGRFVGELSALHTGVYGGDHRKGPDEIKIPTLGARLARDEDGYRVDYIYRSDPDYPETRSPLADPDLGIGEGDVIESVNGVDALSVHDIGALLRNQGGRQVRLRVKDAETGESRDVVVVPTDDERALRYRDWEYTRRLKVEEDGGGQIAYVHLQAMGGGDINAWYRQFYPVFNRQGLILDFRHNRGGNIDSLILEKLLRQAWFYWKPRVGEPFWNMQYAFRGHVVALCDQNTASDGEAVIEGFRRLGLGKLIGTRTWGGEIWLSGVNRLSDGGIATAPMFGVYGPEGEWLIEGHGVDPDIEVDNLPHATFNGEDAQLDAAVEYLLEEIRKDPRTVPPPPAYPDKSFEYPEVAGGER